MKDALSRDLPQASPDLPALSDPDRSDLDHARNTGANWGKHAAAELLASVGKVPPKESAAAFHERTQSRLTVSLRQDRNGEHWIRVSPHFMNDEDDVEAICALLAA